MTDPLPPEPVSLLTLEFLHWVARRHRTYGETMEAWRSTCPRQTVWEDALGDGLIRLDPGGTRQQATVTLTPRGREILERSEGPREERIGS